MAPPSAAGPLIDAHTYPRGEFPVARDHWICEVSIWCAAHIKSHLACGTILREQFVVVASTVHPSPITRACSKVADWIGKPLIRHFLFAHLALALRAILPSSWRLASVEVCGICAKLRCLFIRPHCFLLSKPLTHAGPPTSFVDLL
jgi:hypothetical protein